MKIIDNFRLNIDEEEVLRYQGCDSNNLKNVNPIIIKITREEIDKAYSLIETKGIYDFVKVNQIHIDKGELNLTNGLSLNVNNRMLDSLKEIDYIVFGIVTIGHFLEDKVFEYFSSKDFPKALALDAAGTVSVRYLRSYLSDLIYKKAGGKRLYITKYYSPGEEGWAIDQQKNIFQIIPADKIGVKITDSYMMIPQKSLSFISGIGMNPEIATRKEHSCKTCKAINCQFRKNFD
jgi:hypothetical protein